MILPVTKGVVNLAVRGSNPNSKVGSVFGAQVRGYPYGNAEAGVNIESGNRKGG
jgi:hypothetical protein